MKSIRERVRAAQAAQDKARKDAEYKSGESARRSQAARYAAQTRKDNRIVAVLDGHAQPRTAEEFRMLDRVEFSDGELAERDDFEALQDYVE